jgi:hypothetical protein
VIRALGELAPFAVVVVLVAQSLLLVRIAGRLGGVRGLLLPAGRRPGLASGVAEIGRPPRRIPCVPAAPGSVLVLADTRSVAARRLAALLHALGSGDRPPVDWTWCVGGSAADVARFATDLDLPESAVRVSRALVRRGQASGVPVAVYVDRLGVVRQIGRVSERNDLAAFVGACPDAAFRQWLRRAAGARARSEAT